VARADDSGFHVDAGCLSLPGPAARLLETEQIMQSPKNETSAALSDSDTPASRPGVRTIIALGGAMLAVAALVYAQEIKLFLHLS
jgi:hypothetical protein